MTGKLRRLDKIMCQWKCANINYFTETYTMFDKEGMNSGLFDRAM